jgi:phosphonatase-like hydrolase
MIELVVFDMAGTTVQDNDAVRIAFRGALHQYGIQANEERITTVMGLPKPEAIRLLLLEASREAPDGLVDTIHADFVQRMKDYYAHDPEVGEIPGTSAVFTQLKQSGIKCALNTGFSRDIVEVLLNRLGWKIPETIDATVTSDEVPRGRPFPDMIKYLMKLLKIDDAKKVAKVGDTWADLEEGTNAGCGMIIGVTSGSYTQDKLTERPHTHIIHSVKELPSLLSQCSS